MFTALFMTRFYFTGWLKNPQNTSLSMANWIRASNFDFLKKARYAFAAVFAIVAIGSAALVSEHKTILGMDFTGGYALHFELEEGISDPARAVESALVRAGAEKGDFQIRQFEPATRMRVLLGNTMEQPGKPFAKMPLQVDSSGPYAYQKNPRINWVVGAVEEAGLRIAPASLKALDANWTSVSGQMSDSMRNNALIGLAISFIAIFVYIAFRFESKYAASAILCLLHDVLITLGFIGILHLLKVPVQIDLNTIAAIMTIIGYSLNDTIIIFDRIREDAEHHPHQPISQIVTRALNATLSRTAITSGTTMLVLLALLFFGGATLFSFSLVMTIGVFFGTLSSWFIAAPLLLFFHRREQAREKKVQKIA
jgi:SecD/SecF fusion protein